MQIGVLQIELYLPEAGSLKDKRRVVLSLKDAVVKPPSIAVAEVDALDKHRRAVLGITTVSNDGKHIRTVLDTIVAKLRDDPRVVLGEHQIEVMSGH